jgi:hypothetical protein
MCHAIVGMLTGGHIIEIDVFKDGSGVTPLTGGSLPLVASAGYVGASIIGVLIILFSRGANGARWSLRALSFAILMSSLLWVRGDWVGVVSSYGWVALLFALSWFLPAKPALFTATFVGVQQCLHSVLALLTLTKISLYSGNVPSDAYLMQQDTHVPGMIWAIGWTLFSLFLMGVTIRGALRKTKE